MTYQEAMKYIRELETKVGSVYSITETAVLAEEAGRPERRLKLIHIAGTNGKGSVCSYISNILAMAGYTVGTYISPVLLDYRERIAHVEKKGEKIEAEWISEEMTARLLSKLRGLCEKMVTDGFSNPSAFEIETVMAFLAFEEWQVDYAVIETGLGGMMDATNIIEHPLQCIFTSISLEHQQILGDSLVKIAKEKYGILKKNAQVISAKQEECFEVLEGQAKRKKAKLYPVSREDVSQVSFTIEKTSFSYKGVPYELHQLGTYQLENAVLAIEGALRLREAGAEKITEESIQAGLRETSWRGRFEILSKEPYLIIDGAHNPDAAKKLAESLEVYFPGEKLNFIFGVLADKDYKKMVWYLRPWMKCVYTVTPPVSRGLSAEQLKSQMEEMFADAEDPVEIKAFDSVEEAYEELTNSVRASSGEKICVCGSLFLYSSIRDLVERAL